MQIRTVLACVACCASVVTAGDLNPPPGPVAPTMKTLDEIEPSTPINADTTPGDADSMFRITQSGRYHLTGNSVAELPGAWLEIASSGVEIDLRGHVVDLGMATTSGIFASVPTARDVTVRNGAFRGGGGTAINLPAVANVTVEDIEIAGAGGSAVLLGHSSAATRCVVNGAQDDGISISGGGTVVGCSVSAVGGFGVRVSTGRIQGCAVGSAGTSPGSDAACFEVACCGTVVDCQALGAPVTGFRAGSDTSIERCMATGVLYGFITGDGGVVRSCSASFCQVDGFATNGPTQFDTCHARTNGNYGFSCFDEATFADCFAEANTFDGFIVRAPASFRGCIARENSGEGFNGHTSSVFESCTSSENTGAGFSAGEGSAFTSCVSRENEDGFVLAADSLADGCLAASNVIDGFRIVSGTVRGSAAHENGNDGIEAGNLSVVRDNTLTENGHHGILVTGFNTAVVGNTLTLNPIRIDGSQCRVIGNSILMGVLDSVEITGTSNLVIRNDWDTFITHPGGSNVVPVAADPATAGANDNIQH